MAAQISPDQRKAQDSFRASRLRCADQRAYSRSMGYADGPDCRVHFLGLYDRRLGANDRRKLNDEVSVHSRRVSGTGRRITDSRPYWKLPTRPAPTVASPYPPALLQSAMGTKPTPIKPKPVSVDDRRRRGPDENSCRREGRDCPFCHAGVYNRRSGARRRGAVDRRTFRHPEDSPVNEMRRSNLKGRRAGDRPYASLPLAPGIKRAWGWDDFYKPSAPKDHVHSAPSPVITGQQLRKAAAALGYGFPTIPVTDAYAFLGVTPPVKPVEDQYDDLWDGKEVSARERDVQLAQALSVMVLNLKAAGLGGSRPHEDLNEALKSVTRRIKDRERGDRA